MRTASHTWPRLFVEEKLSTGTFLTLEAEQSHYLVNVLRASEGNPLRIFNGADGEWQATISDSPKSKKKGVTLTIQTLLREQTAEPDLWLCCAPIKRTHFDFMIMKATELGVSVIQPILSARTQIREAKPERLRAIAIEAAEQSERLTIPEIRPPLTLDRLIKTWPAKRLPVLCAEFGNAQPVAQALQGALARARPCAAIVTGPEGGFTQEEMAQLQAMPEILPVRLGPRILRADTAAIAALSCWQSLCGDWQNRDFQTRPSSDNEAHHDT